MSEVTREELQRRLGEDGLVVLDVRSEIEFRGEAGYPCDVRQGHLPGARHVDVLHARRRRSDAAEIRALVGAPEGAEVIAYCHSGVRSASAVEMLRAAGYEARELRRLVARVVGRPRAPDRGQLGA